MIESGHFCFPKDLCAEILMNCAINYIKEHPHTTIKVIRFINIDKQTTDIFLNEIA